MYEECRGFKREGRNPADPQALKIVATPKVRVRVSKVEKTCVHSKSFLRRYDLATLIPYLIDPSFFRTMENLTSEDHGPSSGPSSGPQAPSTQPVVPQLPPQMFTTAAQLLDLTDSEFSMAGTKPASYSRNSRVH